MVLEQYRGKRVLLVFSDVKWGPSAQMVPDLERIALQRRDLQVLMVSCGDLEENRRKAAEHRLTFPIGLQRQWEVSRDYAMFATPIAYLIDPAGVIEQDVATGTDAIRALATLPPAESFEEPCRCGKRVLVQAGARS